MSKPQLIPPDVSEQKTSRKELRVEFKAWTPEPLKDLIRDLASTPGPSPEEWIALGERPLLTPTRRDRLQQIEMLLRLANDDQMKSVWPRLVDLEPSLPERIALLCAARYSLHQRAPKLSRSKAERAARAAAKSLVTASGLITGNFAYLYDRPGVLAKPNLLQAAVHRVVGVDLTHQQAAEICHLAYPSPLETLLVIAAELAMAPRLITAAPEQKEHIGVSVYGVLVASGLAQSKALQIAATVAVVAVKSSVASEDVAEAIRAAVRRATAKRKGDQGQKRPRRG